MAYSASTGFRFRKSLSGKDEPAAVNFRVANSSTLKIGDAVRLNTGGFLVRAAAGNPVLGVLVGLYGGDSENDGLNLFAFGAPTTGATLTEDDQAATASDNQTRQTFVSGAVACDPSGDDLWYNDADGDLARTNLLQCFDVVAASGQIDNTSASDSNGQFQLVQLDPDGDGDLSKGLFRIAEGELAVGVDQCNAKVAA